MAFRNRAEAAHKLAERLSAYKGKNPLVSPSARRGAHGAFSPMPWAGS
jgi:predicted phosphoribosyltransferase